MEKIFRLKDNNRMLIFGSDEIVEKDGKFYLPMRSLANTNFEDDSVPHINLEWKEVEEVNIVPIVSAEEIYKKLIKRKEEV